MPVQNIHDNAAPPITGERFDTLLRCRNLVIERIASSSVIAPNQYIQAQDERVLLVQGTAKMDIDGQTELLRAGDYVFLPANTPHSVKQVSEGAIWLAIHLHRDHWAANVIDLTVAHDKQPHLSQQPITIDLCPARSEMNPKGSWRLVPGYLARGGVHPAGDGVTAFRPDSGSENRSLRPIHFGWQHPFAIRRWT